MKRLRVSKTEGFIWKIKSTRSSPASKGIKASPEKTRTETWTETETEIGAEVSTAEKPHLDKT